MTTESNRFKYAQRARLIELRTLVKNKPAHAEFLEDLLDALPGEILDDLPLPRGVARKVADALIADVEWTRQAAPEPGMSIMQYPDAYKQLRIKQARAAAQAAHTRADNVTWSGFSFGGK